MSSSVVAFGRSPPRSRQVNVGIKPESAYYESLHETPLIANTIARKKLYEVPSFFNDEKNGAQPRRLLEASPDDGFGRGEWVGGLFVLCVCARRRVRARALSFERRGSERPGGTSSDDEARVACS